MTQTKTALEKKETPVPNESIFVTAEHFLEDFAKQTQEITKRAFELFETRGRQFGHDLEDWLKAEAEVLRRVPIDIKEKDGKLHIRAQVPGFTADNLKVSVEPRRVTLKGETEQKTEQKDDGTLYTEWRSNKIFRVFDLPQKVTAEKAKATIKDGVLTLLIPKAVEVKPNEVEIKPT